MVNKVVIGIDPGVNGGIAVLDDCGKIVEVTNMPPTLGDLLEFLGKYRGAVAYLEKVGGMPGQGGVAMFNFGKGFGHLEMALLANGIRTVEISPAKWQKPLLLGPGSRFGKTEWKNRLKGRAQQLFPNIKVTLAIADALLIANYGVGQEK